MGMFSWITSDTERSVLVDGSVAVKMLSPDGRVFEERNYEGYGIFGGQDYFELVAELNGLGDDRQDGIDLLYNNSDSGDADEAAERGVRFPKIVSIDADGSYDDYDHSKSCPEQGFRDWEDNDCCDECGDSYDYCCCDDI